MALKRATLKAMGLTDEQVASIIEMHTETVDGLNAELSKYKTDAEKLDGVQKELDALKAKGDDGWKAKHDTLQADFDKYKNDIETAKSKAAKDAAVRAYYESKKITGKNLDIAMRGSRAEIDALELDGDNIKDASALDALIAGDFAALIVETDTTGAPVHQNLGSNAGGAQDLGKLSMAEYIAARTKK